MPTNPAENKRPLIIIGLILVLVAVLGVWWYAPSNSTNAVPFSQSVGSIRPVSANAYQGNFQAAVERYQSISSSATSTPLVRALATNAAAFLPYAVTNNPADAAASIQSLKELVADSSLPSPIRAKAVLRLAQWYGVSNYDTTIFDDVFTGDSYAQYRVVGDTEDARMNSVLKLLLRSFQIYPKHRTAIYIAKIYAGEAMDSTDASTTKADVYNAEQYLTTAEALAAHFTATTPEITVDSVTEQEAYLYDHADVIGMLAMLNVSPYTTEYRKNYQDLFSFVQQWPDANLQSYLPIAYFEYADALLSVDNDAASAKVQLQQSMDLVSSGQQPAKSRLAVEIQRIQKNDSPNEMKLLDGLLNLSSQFKSFVDSIK